MEVNKAPFQPFGEGGVSISPVKYDFGDFGREMLTSGLFSTGSMLGCSHF